MSSWSARITASTRPPGKPEFTDWWHGWWPIGNTLVPAGGPVHAVSRSADKLDIFATNVYGVIQTAAWEPGFTDGGHGWWPLAWEPGFTDGTQNFGYRTEACR